MNSYISLTKTFIASISMSQPQDKRRKVMIVILSLFGVFGVLLPVSIAVGVLVKLMTETLLPLGCSELGIELMFHVISLFTVIFGLNVIFNEFYFSNDIEYLLPLPLRAWQIVASKFSAAFFSENLMQIVLVISCVIGFGIGSGMGIGNWVLSIVGIITLPIIPLAYCGILCILVMAFTRLVRNKDLIQRLSVIILFLLILGLVGSIGFLQDMDISSYVATLATEEPSFLRIMNCVFPEVPLFVQTLSQGSILSLAGYLLLHVVAIGILLGAAECFYFRGVIGLNSSGSRAAVKNADRLIQKSRQHSPAFAYFMKEVRILLRTPVFFTNSIAINFVWPIFVYAMYKIQSRSFSLTDIRTLYRQRDIRIQLLFLLGIVGISVIVSALNSLSSNAISREGKHFSFMKYIPVSYYTQWHVKAFVAILFSVLGVWVYFIPACILVQIPLLHTVLFLFLSLMSVTFVSYLGLYIDSIQPKLIWDDEMSALRENYNTFFSMAISIAFTVIVCVGGFFLFCNTKISITFTALILIALLAAANLIVFILTSRSGIRNIEEQEEA